MKGMFITGTDTGVGKTYTTAAIVRALRERGIPALGLKPFLCGERGDAEILAHANGETLALDEINPVWLMPPLSPYAACLVEDRRLDWDAMRENLNRLANRFPGPFLIEGVGGWLVPMDETRTVRDWAMELGLPVLVVCRAGLGTLNHTLLTIESIRATGLPMIGLVMNHHACGDDLATRTNGPILEQLTGLPLLPLHEKQQRLDLPDWLLACTTS